MDNNILRHFHVNYKQIIIDEIALDGLEGTGLDLLWRRVGKRISSEITEKMKARLWQYVVTCSKVAFYEVPAPLPYVELLDRFDIVDPTSGHLQEPADYIDGYYEYSPIEGERGSSLLYHTRILIHHAKLQEKTYQQIVQEYGDRLVIVANEEERIRALAPHVPSCYVTSMTQLHYCLLELIGKSRVNGQMTIGKTNLLKVMKEPKNLFYIRKHLRALDLIRISIMTQTIGGRGTKSLLVRLTRFHQPSVLSMAKRGNLHDMVEYLWQQPDYCERSDVVVRQGFITQKQSKRLQKNANIFNFEERTIPDERIKKANGPVKKKFIYLSSKNEESSESDEEPQGPPLQCQYKVGVSLLRQAYERFLDAGLDGLTQIQLAQLLGVKFYTSRTICRIFKMRNIVREYLEDRGKQRTARFIAVATTGEIDVKYAEERKKFSDFLKQIKVPSGEAEPEPQSTLPETSDDDIPLKKIKLEKDMDNDNELVTGINFNFDMSTEHDITEIKILDGVDTEKTLVNFKKNPTLRQLTFANGVFKVLKDKKCVCGYITLSSLVSKEIQEPPLDTKALKKIIQRLVTDGHIKVFKLKWPGIQKYSVLICAPHIKKTDPLIKAKYKEICIRAVTNKRLNLKKACKETLTKPVTQFSYPRYMKIQVLHEFLTKYAYFDNIQPESHSLPQGFVSIVDFIQEVTVEFVVNNMSNLGMTEVSEILNENHLKLKLKDAPQHLYKALMRSNTLQNTIRVNLKVLGMLGLIQLVRRPCQTPSTSSMVTYTSFLFYVNRRAKILDTTGVWPPKSGEKVKEKSYYFETFDDVTKYWNDVYQISTNTVIDLAKRERKKLIPPLREETEVKKYDNGARYGDGNGPCGFDSEFYMEMPRLWRTFYMRPAKTHVSTKKKVKIPKVKITKKPKKSETKVPKLIVEKTNEKLTRKRNDNSVKWTKQDDLILTMCKAAITIMSPSSQPGSLIVRNIVAKDILSILDPKKTKGACHTRAATIENNVNLIHEKQCIINELRRRRPLIQKYEGLLKILRIRYSTNMSKYMNKARLPMMELVWIISQVMKSKSYNERVPCVATSLEDFHEHFTIITSTGNRLCNMYKVPEHANLKEGMVLTIMQTMNSEISTEMGKKIYKTFKEFPEASLRIAVEQLRRCGAIAAKEKIFNNQMRRMELEDIVQSSYKISAFYQRKWVNRLSSEFVDKMVAVMDMEQTENDIKGSAEINCVYCEMHSCDVIDIVSATVPVITDSAGISINPEEINVLVIDAKYRLKTGTLRWKNKSNVKVLSDLYGNLDISNCSQVLSRNNSVGVKELNQNVNSEDKIISHLNSKAENGASFQELQEVTGHERKELIQKLLLLESKKVVKRVGYYENVIILLKYISPWSIKIGDRHIVATPWQDLTGNVRLDIFFKWANGIMNLIFEKPGCSVPYLADKSEYLSYRSVQDICMFLQKYECAKLSCVNNQPIDVFSDEDSEPVFEEFNPYDAPENMLVFSVKNSLTKYACLKKRIENLKL